jgi:tetratricopeptide (TPR) repeat protein
MIGPSMNRLYLKFSTLFLTGIMLTQCGEQKSSQYYVQEGINYSNLEQYDKAEKSFSKAIEKDPKNISAHYGLGGIYNLKKKYADAEKAFKSSIQLDPTYYNAWYSLGYTYELMDKKEDAEKSYEQYHRLKSKIDSLMYMEKH